MTLTQVKRALKAELDLLCQHEEGFVIDTDNRQPLTEVCEWIQGGDFRKGFNLRGPVGTGKSLLVKAVGNIMRNAGLCKGIRSVEAVELVNVVAKARGDRSILAEYADHTKYPFLWIEDLDTEGNAPSFVKGDEGINCIAELIQVRYKRWEMGFPLTTGFTTNATNARLVERYGERCCSRMSHMVKVIGLPGPNRRATAVLPETLNVLPAAQSPVDRSEPSLALAAMVNEIKAAHDVKQLDRVKAEAKRKSNYLDDMRVRVRRMELADLHEVIQNDVFTEARDIARNQFEQVAPHTYAEFLEMLKGDNPITLAHGQ